MYVGGRSDCGGEVGSSGVRITVSGGVGQSSSGSRVSTQGLSAGLVPCLNQSRIMNCSQDAIKALPAVAGMISSRVIRRRLITRGLGSRMLALSGHVTSSGTLRPKRAPAIPISGWARSFQLPSKERSVSNAGSYGGASGVFTDGSQEVSYMFCSRRVFRIPMRSSRPSGLGSLNQPM